jgi:hypothetical protein
MSEQRPLVNYGEIIGPLEPGDHLPGAAYVFATKDEFDAVASSIPAGARVTKLYEALESLTAPVTGYDSEERKTNETWLDGRPIYRRTFTFSTNEYTEGPNQVIYGDISGILSADLDFVIKSEVLSHEGSYSVDDSAVYHTVTLPSPLTVVNDGGGGVWDVYLQNLPGSEGNSQFVITAWYVKRYSPDSGQIFTWGGEHDLVIPEGVHAIDVTLVGCGGEGGKAFYGASYTFGRTGGGGGSGYIVKTSLVVTPGETLKVTLSGFYDGEVAGPTTIHRGSEMLAFAAPGGDGGTSTALENGAGGVGRINGSGGELLYYTSGGRVKGGAGGAAYAVFYGRGGEGWGLYPSSSNPGSFGPSQGGAETIRTGGMALALWRR